MICITITQESRRLALVDMHNAAPQCDLLEVRLDRFGKAPELGELIAGKPRPVIMSCRRPQDGGYWDGTENERLALLRQCIIDRADYVEMEVDVADQIRKFPPAKRVISYTNLAETPPDIANIYEEALEKSPDVIKLAIMARTPEEAWPLVQILAKATVPTVVVGLGKPGIMLTVLGQKLNAPWAYAALERGMESYPGQPTVRELRETYHFPSLRRSTRFVGVSGFEEADRATVAALNAVFAAQDLPARCLPLGVGSMKLFGKVIDAVKLPAVVIDGNHRGAVLGIADELDGSAAASRSADVMLRKGDKWLAFDTHSHAAMSALEAAVRTRHPGDKPLKGRFTLIVGAGSTAAAMAQHLKARGAALIIASHDRSAAQRVAQLAEGRVIQFEAIYSTMHDVLVVCDREEEHAGGKSALRANYLKPAMTVLDLTATARTNEFVREAMARGCAVVTPLPLWFDQVAKQARLLTGKEVPRKVLEDAVPWLIEEEAAREE